MFALGDKKSPGVGESEIKKITMKKMGLCLYIITCERDQKGHGLSLYWVFFANMIKEVKNKKLWLAFRTLDFNDHDYPR